MPIIWRTVPRPQSRIYDISLQDLLRPWVRSCVLPSGCRSSLNHSGRRTIDPRGGGGRRKKRRPIDPSKATCLSVIFCVTLGLRQFFEPLWGRTCHATCPSFFHSGWKYAVTTQYHCFRGSSKDSQGKFFYFILLLFLRKLPSVDVSHP